ncbi:hypothetical protein [Thermostichus sp. OS-CIW-26]
MSNRNLKHSLRSTLASLALASSLTGVVAACSADTPTVTQVPSTISAQVPETAAPVAEGLSFYYDGVKTSVSSKDAAVLFAACSLNTGDAAKIVGFVNNTLKAGPITASDVTGLGDPLQPAISDFNGNGVVNCEDAAILFAVSTVGVDAAKVNAFVSGTLKIPGVSVTQAQLDTFFKTPPTPTPTPTPTIKTFLLTPDDLKLPSGSSQSVTVALPSAPLGNVTVTVTPSSGITATPATLTFTPTVFGGTVTVSSTATPGTTGTVKFSAPGYADGVVNVTVDQSTNLVVDPASLSIPANGAGSFKVKLAKDPIVPVTVTVTPSSGITATPATLAFAPINFSSDKTVLVSAGLGAVPGAQSVLLDAGSLGKFNLPVTITPASNTTFFIDPTNGNDAFPGTAAKPWKFVQNALNGSQSTGSQVAAVAIAGNDVVVTILGSGTSLSETVNNSISTPALVAGSVTVLQAPFPKTFKLVLGDNKLTLNKGYKLQDIKIDSNRTTNGTSVEITHPTAGLASVEFMCGSNGASVTCVEVAGAGSHTLKGVELTVAASDSGNTGIKNNANANLSIVGGRVQTGAGSNAITLINGQWVLTVTDLTVDMTENSHGQASKGIILNAPGSSITGSTIKVNSPPSGSNAKGIVVQLGASKSTVEGNTFIGYGTNSVALTGNSNLFFDALSKNTFFGTFASGGPVQ